MCHYITDFLGIWWDTNSGYTHDWFGTRHFDIIHCNSSSWDGQDQHWFDISASDSRIFMFWPKHQMRLDFFAWKLKCPSDEKYNLSTKFESWVMACSAGRAGWCSPHQVWCGDTGKAMQAASPFRSLQQKCMEKSSSSCGCVESRFYIILLDVPWLCSFDTVIAWRPFPAEDHPSGLERGKPQAGSPRCITGLLLITVAASQVSNSSPPSPSHWILVTYWCFVFPVV